MTPKVQFLLSCIVVLGLCSASENTIKAHDERYRSQYAPVHSVPNHTKQCPKTERDLDGDCILGMGGVDYPIFSHVPQNNDFDCSAMEFPGLYADPKYKCQVFHVCDLNNRKKSSFLCPNGTIMDQRVLVCSWWFGDFNCEDAPLFYHLNNAPYQTSIPEPQPSTDSYTKPTFYTPVYQPLNHPNPSGYVPTSQPYPSNVYSSTGYDGQVNVYSGFSNPVEQRSTQIPPAKNPTLPSSISNLFSRPTQNSPYPTTRPSSISNLFSRPNLSSPYPTTRPSSYPASTKQSGLLNSFNPLSLFSGLLRQGAPVSPSRINPYRPVANY